MRKSETIKIGEKEILINELTVNQIDGVFGEFDINRSPTRAELLMDSIITEEVVTAATGLKSEELNSDYAPSELHLLWEAVARVNDFLSQMLVRVGNTISALPDSTVKPSADSSAA